MKFLIVTFFLYFCGYTGHPLVVNPVGEGIDCNEENAHSLFTEILKEYVSDGKVNYHDLSSDNRLEEYISRLAGTDPAKIQNDKAKLAFWINAYNAYTLKVICDNYPIKSINELHFGGLFIGTLLKKTVWDKNFVVINGRKISLNFIEHKIIRAAIRDPKAVFTQVCFEIPCPLAHFALVCASKGCPPLRSEAYEGQKLDEQLSDQARIFFGDAVRNYFNVEKKEAHLSKILDWFADDFGKNDEERLLFVANFLPDTLAESIRAISESWKIRYTKYDWSLHE